jgi:hypothetical protein
MAITEPIQTTIINFHERITNDIPLLSDGDLRSRLILVQQQLEFIIEGMKHDTLQNSRYNGRHRDAGDA